MLRLRSAVLWLLLSATAATWIAAPVLAAGPRVGEPAPAFTLPGSDGRSHALADHLGKRGVVLAWFPKAFTPG